MLERIAAATTAFHARWLELIRDAPGNPSGVEVRYLADGRIVGTMATELPEVEWLQHVAGLRAGDDEAIFELATWYAELEAWPRYEVPVDAEDELLHTLLAVEAKPTGALAVVGAALGDLAPVAVEPAVAVRRIEAGSADVAPFATTMLGGHEVPDGGAPDHIAAVEAWVEQSGWECFLATVDGEAVGAGCLTVLDGTGYLANAATLPSERGQGVQTALIAARIDAATAAGCEVVCSLATPDSSSARNLVRAGLGVVGARTYWSAST